MLSLFLFIVRNQSLLCWLGLREGLGYLPLIFKTRERPWILWLSTLVFFWESRTRGPESPPSLSSWICTEESRCPAWPSWCCWQDLHAPCPSPLILAAWLLDPISLEWNSAVQEPFLGAVPCFHGPSLPPTWWGHQLLTRRGLTKKALKAVDLSALVPALMPPTCPTTTTCSAWSVYMVLYVWESRLHPPATPEESQWAY